MNLYENTSNNFMDYNLYNFCFRTFVLIYRFVGMVSNSRTTGKSTYNCYCYDGNTCYQRHYTVLDKKKVKILSFQAHLIRVIKFKTPKKLRTSYEVLNFFIQAGRLGISSRFCVYIIAVGVYHHTFRCVSLSA